jgi:FkbM family methyltransferase
MRNFGLTIIKLISLIRYYKLFEGIKIYSNSLFPKKGNFVINSKVFKNKIYLREKQSDPLIFEQIFCEQQYNYPHPNPNEVSWIIDAGANIGLAAIYFTTKFPNAKIISIEPNLSNFELLQKNTKNYKNIICLNAALWHQEEILSISNLDELSAGFVIEPNLNPLEENLSIKSKSINDLMIEYKIDKISILKIDIEGSEREIFQYNTTPWINNSDCIITEIHDWIKPGASQAFFKKMSEFKWVTYIKGENIICIKETLFK